MVACEVADAPHPTPYPSLTSPDHGQSAAAAKMQTYPLGKGWMRIQRRIDFSMPYFAVLAEQVPQP